MVLCQQIAHGAAIAARCAIGRLDVATGVCRLYMATRSSAALTENTVMARGNVSLGKGTACHNAASPFAVAPWAVLTPKQPVQARTESAN